MVEIRDDLVEDIVELTRRIPILHIEESGPLLVDLAPEKECLTNGSANTKIRYAQAILDSVLTEFGGGNSGSSFYEIQVPDGDVKKGRLIFRQFSKLEKFVYKILLAIIFFVFGMLRYALYQYNQMRLSLLHLIYNPSRIPHLIRRDTLRLKKMPTRVAFILEAKPIGQVGGGLYGLLSNAAEVVSWSVYAGVKEVILYDMDGYFQKNIFHLEDEIYSSLMNYSSRNSIPNFTIYVPHSGKTYKRYHTGNNESREHISVTVLSHIDGRPTVVNVVKSIIQLCKESKMSVGEISMELVNSVLTRLVCDEPDLLVYFGPTLDLQGFPPWQIRLTELFWEQDNNRVSYSVFIRALNHYSNCKINLGK